MHIVWIDLFCVPSLDSVVTHLPTLVKFNVFNPDFSFLSLHLVISNAFGGLVSCFTFYLLFLCDYALAWKGLALLAFLVRIFKHIFSL